MNLKIRILIFKMLISNLSVTFLIYNRSLMISYIFTSEAVLLILIKNFNR